MNKGIKQVLSIITVGLFLPLYASSAIALNPQPEPPGIQQNSESTITPHKTKSKKNHNVIKVPKGSDMSSDSSTS